MQGRKEYMIDFDSIWRTQDEIRTVVRSAFGRLLPTGRKNAVLGALDLGLFKLKMEAITSPHAQAFSGCTRRLLHLPQALL